MASSGVPMTPNLFSTNHSAASYPLDTLKHSARVGHQCRGACHVRHPGVEVAGVGVDRLAAIFGTGLPGCRRDPVSVGRDQFRGQLLVPLYFLKLRGTPPGLTGLLLAPMGLDVFLALPIMGRLSEHYGARIIPGGGTTIALKGTRPFALGGTDMPLAVLAAAYSSVPCESLGHATTAINICQRFGGPV
jgi:hypothetical protein